MNFVLLLSAILTSSLGAATLRFTQAHSRTPLVSVVVNYIVAGSVLAVYGSLRGLYWHPNALLCGLLTGLFYPTALMLILKNMGQRGMAVTVASTGLAQMMPVVTAIAFGERPTHLQYGAIAAAILALPFLSLSTVAGRSITGRPRFLLLVALILCQGGAMSGNYVASQLVPLEAKTTYMLTLFLWALTVSIGLLFFLERRIAIERNDVARGGVFGAFNACNLILMLAALERISGTVFYAALGAGVFLLNTVFAVTLWRERFRAFGYIGLALSVTGIVLLTAPA